MKTWASEIRAVALAVATVSGLLYLVGKPHAENFITHTVAGQKYAKEYQVKRLNKKADKAIATTEENRTRGIRMETKQETILQLLQELRQRQNNIRN